MLSCLCLTPASTSRPFIGNLHSRTESRLWCLIYLKTTGDCHCAALQGRVLFLEVACYYSFSVLSLGCPEEAILPSKVTNCKALLEEHLSLSCRHRNTEPRSTKQVKREGYNSVVTKFSHRHFANVCLFGNTEDEL